QFFLDANRVNARCKLSAMNQLEKWNADDVISLRFPEHAQSEAESGRDARRTQKARRFLIPYALIKTDKERKQLSKIKRIIFGDGYPGVIRLRARVAGVKASRCLIGSGKVELLIR